MIIRTFRNLGLLWGSCLLLVLLNAYYWFFVASDRYVSETNVVLDSPEIVADSFNMAAMLSSSNVTSDLLLLRDHLLSVDMLKKVDKELNLRQHFSSDSIDIASRMWDENAPIEKFHEYFLSRVSADVDDYAGVLRIKVQAFTPSMAYRIAKTMLSFGEEHMNQMGQKLASEQVRFIEKQLEQLSIRLADSREALITYQNKHGMISPTGAVESISAVIAGLENELAQITARRNALRNFQSKNSPEIIKLSSQIKAIEQQISSEQSRMAASSGDALNKLSAEYEALQMQSKFALDLYSNALSSLENARVEAVRKLKQVSVLQKPTLPEYSVEPRRFYNVVSFAMVIFLLGLVVQMMIMIVRDHRD